MLVARSHMNHFHLKIGTSLNYCTAYSLFDLIVSKYFNPYPKQLANSRNAYYHLQEYSYEIKRALDCLHRHLIPLLFSFFGKFQKKCHDGS